MTATPFPLRWPQGRPRRASLDRRLGKFSDESMAWPHLLTIAAAIQRLQRELDMVGARFAVISTNVEVRLDGLLRSGAKKPDDPGVAVYFQLNGKPTCLPCDTYTEVAQNIAAIAAHIEATRAIERHGVATVAEMFKGFAALEAAPGVAWWDVLDVRPDADEQTIEAAFRAKAKAAHPDAGGSHDAMARLNAAREAARERAA